MNGDAIQVVSKAVVEVVNAALVRQAIPGGVFVGPLDDPDANGHAAVLFLYRVAVNADLRNSAHTVPAAVEGDPPLVHDGALPLDLYYLLTGGTAQTGGELDTGLRVLGFAMQALNDSPYLLGLPVQGETVRLTFDSVSSEEMSRIWALFPTANYRTSVIYLASPVWIDPATSRLVGPPVTADVRRVGPRER
jgi:hypothetical protein